MRSSTSRHLVGAAAGLLLVATTAVGCQGSDSGQARATSPTTAPTAAAGQRTYFAQYGTSTHAYRPSGLNPSVDGSLFVRHMQWTIWNGRVAIGDGIAHVNDCKPDCADGHYSTHRVTVRLSHPRELCGSRFFSTIRMTGSTYHTYGHWKGIGCR